MELDTAKGTRDIYPTEQLLRENIIQKMTSIFSRYGFVPLDTPLLERRDILCAKFAAGEQSDALDETYLLEDNGGRPLGLRFDLTVPVSRFVGMNPKLKMPFKRYQFGKVYRDAPIKAGRYREFTQCDVDIIGTNSVLSDVTCISIAIDVYNALGIEASVQINNRQFLLDMVSHVGILNEQADSVIMSVDKLDKIGKTGVLKEIAEKGINSEAVEQLLGLLMVEGSNIEKIEFFKNILPDNEGLKNIEETLSYFQDATVVEFVPMLARGLNYYTGNVFEVYAKNDKSIGAISGGGRYDSLIGSYLISVKNAKVGETSNAEKTTSEVSLSQERKYPAIGISFGLDRIVDVLGKLNLITEQLTRTHVFVIPISTQKESFTIVSRLRNAGINSDIDLMGRGPSKNMQYANSQNIPFVIVVGENELEAGVVSLKNLVTGIENKCTLDDAIQTIQSTLRLQSE